MVIKLTRKTAVAICIIPIAILIGYDIILEEGLFGNEEEHVVTVQWKKQEFDPQAECRIYYLADEKGNKYTTHRDIYAKIQPGKSYLLKTGKRNLRGGCWHVNYAEELPKSRAME